jgi:hypothetical protein
VNRHAHERCLHDRALEQQLAGEQRAVELSPREGPHARQSAAIVILRS